MGHKICVESAETSYDQCSEYADRGYEECDNWRSECCDWWPCSWFCEIVSWFCTSWIWISNVVCVLWETITLVVCLVWATIEIIVAPLSAIIELIKSIPIIGRAIDLILNIVMTIIWRLVRLPEALASFTNTEATLTVRLCAMVLRRNNAFPASPVDPSREISREDIEAMAQTADQVWLGAANIHVALSRVEFLSDDAPQEASTPNCGTGGGSFADQFGIAGSYFQFAAATKCCATGGLSRAIGFNSTILVIFVHDLSGNCRGTALGPLNDYLLIAPNAGDLTLAHELGHKLALAHHGDRTNLMTGMGTRAGSTTLEWWQRIWARGSKYASHF